MWLQWWNRKIEKLVIIRVEYERILLKVTIRFIEFNTWHIK
jgi:hypothetical protein